VIITSVRSSSSVARAREANGHGMTRAARSPLSRVDRRPRARAVARRPMSTSTPLARAGTSANDARARARRCARTRDAVDARERLRDSTLRARSRTRREVSHGGRIAHTMTGARWDLSTSGFRA
jgi:hypothetical protein